MQLRSLDNYSLLRKTFLRLVSHDDSDISVVALAAMISTGMSDELNKLVSRCCVVLIANVFHGNSFFWEKRNCSKFVKEDLVTKLFWS